MSLSIDHDYERPMNMDVEDDGNSSPKQNNDGIQLDEEEEQQLSQASNVTENNSQEAATAYHDIEFDQEEETSKQTVQKKSVRFSASNLEDVLGDDESATRIANPEMIRKVLENEKKQVRFNAGDSDDDDQDDKKQESSDSDDNTNDKKRKKLKKKERKLSKLDEDRIYAKWKREQSIDIPRAQPKKKSAIELNNKLLAKRNMVSAIPKAQVPKLRADLTLVSMKDLPQTDSQLDALVAAQNNNYHHGSNEDSDDDDDLIIVKTLDSEQPKKADEEPKQQEEKREEEEIAASLLLEYTPVDASAHNAHQNKEQNNNENNNDTPTKASAVNTDAFFSDSFKEPSLGASLAVLNENIVPEAADETGALSLSLESSFANEAKPVTDAGDDDDDEISINPKFLNTRSPPKQHLQHNDDEQDAEMNENLQQDEKSSDFVDQEAEADEEDDEAANDGENELNNEEQAQAEAEALQLRTQRRHELARKLVGNKHHQAHALNKPLGKGRGVELLKIVQQQNSSLASRVDIQDPFITPLSAKKPELLAKQMFENTLSQEATGSQTAADEQDADEEKQDEEGDELNEAERQRLEHIEKKFKAQQKQKKMAQKKQKENIEPASATSLVSDLSYGSNISASLDSVGSSSSQQIQEPSSAVSTGSLSFPSFSLSLSSATEVVDLTNHHDSNSHDKSKKAKSVVRGSFIMNKSSKEIASKYAQSNQAKIIGASSATKQLLPQKSKMQAPAKMLAKKDSTSASRKRSKSPSVSKANAGSSAAKKSRSASKQ